MDGGTGMFRAMTAREAGQGGSAQASPQRRLAVGGHDLSREGCGVGSGAGQDLPPGDPCQVLGYDGRADDRHAAGGDLEDLGGRQRCPAKRCDEYPGVSSGAREVVDRSQQTDTRIGAKRDPERTERASDI